MFLDFQLDSLQRLHHLEGSDYSQDYPNQTYNSKRPGGVGKFKGGRDYGYIQSFGGWFTGKVGKTKGLMIGGREVYTGLEIRGREVKKKK